MNMSDNGNRDRSYKGGGDRDSKDPRDFRDNTNPGIYSHDEHDPEEDMLDDDLDSKGGGRRQYDLEKDRRMFSRKKNCWFCAKEISPDWKDPYSYSWLVNEFGKIAPSRINGLCATHQRQATTAIKRGRNMCLIGHLSNQIVH